MDSDNALAWIICAVIAILLFILMVFGIFNKYILGNKQFIDTKQSFNTAYVSFPDGSNQIIKIKAWNDYRQSDSIQIIDMNGKPYYTHLNRVILTNE
jgi:hypothetical protein